MALVSASWQRESSKHTHWLEHALVGLVRDSVSQREVAAVILPLPESSVSQSTSTREEFTIFVKAARHHSIRSVESLLHTISVMNVDVDVEHARMVAQQLENAEDDIVDVTEPARFAFLGVMQPSSPVDRDVAFVARQPRRSLFQVREERRSDQSNRFGRPKARSPTHPCFHLH